MRSGEKPYRILLVLEPPDGGVAEHVFELACGLGKHGFCVEVAGPANSSIVPRLQALGITHHAVPVQRSYGRPDEDLRAVARLWALVRRHRFDIVHSHSSKAGVVGRLIARAAGIKTVYSPHCFGFVGDVSRARELVALTTERALGRLTHAIVCVCENERDVALDLGVATAGRLITILQGTSMLQPGIERDPGLLELAARGPVVGTVTSLRRQKRVDVLLRSIPLVWRARPDTQFAVVGTGPCESALRALADDLGLARDPRFLFAPFTAPSQRYLESLALFVLNSDWEALPISVLEAMACGVPPVVTDVGGLREVIDETVGQLLPARNPDALAEAIVDLLGNETKRLAMAAAVVRRHTERFTVERMVSETAALYGSLMNPDSAVATTTRGVS